MSESSEERKKKLRRELQDKREHSIENGEDSTEAWREYLDKFNNIERKKLS